MFKMVINRTIIITGAISLFFIGSVKAQPEKIREALTAVQNLEFYKAKDAIDAASTHEQTSGDAKTWYYRGYIYKEIYKTSESSNPSSPLRMKSVEFFLKAISLDKEAKITKDCEANIKFLANTFYNDAVRSLDAGEHVVAVTNFEKYKKIIKVAEPGIDLSQKDIEFYLALGGLYTKIFESDKNKNARFWAKARDCYNRVLSIDDDNLSANYNLGIHYYNKAVNIINKTDYDIDLVSFNDILDTCVVLFKESLPYMETAYKMQPQNENTLIGLSGIYFGLNEVEKSNKMKEELKTIRQ